MLNLNVIKLTVQRISLLTNLIENLPIVSNKNIQDALNGSQAFLKQLEDLAYSFPRTDENVESYKHCYLLAESKNFDLQYAYNNY